MLGKCDISEWIFLTLCELVMKKTGNPFIFLDLITFNQRAASLNGHGASRLRTLPGIELQVEEHP